MTNQYSRITNAAKCTFYHGNVGFVCVQAVLYRDHFKTFFLKCGDYFAKA